MSEFTFADLHIPGRLKSAAPGWVSRADVIIVGSGVAGLSAALHVRRSGYSVCLLTKAQIDEGSTRWAQGGIAAALDPDDSPMDHWRDTLLAGGGLCDPDAVMALVTEGPDAVRRLVTWGAEFDLDPSGELALTREGGHHKDRIAHAGGDATGAEVSRTLVTAVQRDPGIEIIEHALVLDLLKDDAGAAQGVTLHVMGAGVRDGVGAVLAPAVVLATGGIGQVYSQSTNPSVVTGDGLALALRAGAELNDIEFIQFHPTVLWLGGRSEGQQPLISEAVRGEGAILRDVTGRTFMQGVHELADLAPRDVVAKAIVRVMRETQQPHVWLDATMFTEEFWEQRFPTILASCRAHGIDPVTQFIPVAPAQHYLCGGIRTDMSGRTSVPGLYACGECAGTGVHGANRLASNSLLEGLVLAERIGRDLAGQLPQRRPAIGAGESVDGVLISDDSRAELQSLMTLDAGPVRDGAELRTTAAGLKQIAGDIGEPCTADWEMTNLWTVAAFLAHAALLRTESRGSHVRADFPSTDDEKWRIRLVGMRGGDGIVEFRHESIRRTSSEAQATS